MCREQLNPLPQLPNVKQARTCFAEVYVSLQLQPFSSALLFPSTTVYVFSDHFPQICLHLSSLSFTDKKSSISSSSAINFSLSSAELEIPPSPVLPQIQLIFVFTDHQLQPDLMRIPVGTQWTLCLSLKYDHLSLQFMPRSVCLTSLGPKKIYLVWQARLGGYEIYQYQDKINNNVHVQMSPLKITFMFCDFPLLNHTHTFLMSPLPSR